LLQETFCYGDVLLRRRFVTGDVLCKDTFCRGDVLFGDVLSRRRFVCASSPDVLSPDVLSRPTLCLRTFCLGTELSLQRKTVSGGLIFEKKNNNILCLATYVHLW
jgi:hypothetical protein